MAKSALRLGLTIGSALFFEMSTAFCQEASVQAPRIIGPLRHLEDYTYFNNTSNRQGLWWESLKYIPLWRSLDAPFITLGGEARVRYEWIDHAQFGSGPQDDGGYLLTRLIPYISLTVPELQSGARIQLFGQFELAFSDYDSRGPAPVDEETLDAIQAFAKITLPIGSGEISVQAGRQVMSLGSERLVGSRYGPNLLLSFDGGVIRWHDPTWDAQAFYLRPVAIDPDPFNNVSEVGKQLWGIYATRQLNDVFSLLPDSAVDFYYLGYFNAEASFNSGAGRELRHTIGTRFFGVQPLRGGKLDWNYEGIFQFGSFDSQRGNGEILAWSLGTETGYTLDAPFTPRLLLRANFISGDQNPNDASLQTFNPLFPKGKYFGELNPVGPYNLINILGGVSFKVTDRINLYVQGGPYWRYSSGDAAYGVPGFIVRSAPERGGAAYIGSQFEVVAEWRPIRELGFLVSYSQFTPGAFIQQTGHAETINFVAVEATLQF